MNFVDWFLNFLHTLPDSVIYLTLGLSALVENVFPPIPGDTITAFGAFLVGTKRLHFVGVYLSTTIGSLSGFMFLFWVGSAVGRRFFIEKNYRFFKAKDIVRAEVWFQRFGYLLVALNRFFPGIRSVISLASGISGLNSLKTAVLALISCGVWNLVWIGFGYTLGTNWETMREKMAHIMVRYNLLVLALLILVILFFLAKKMFKRS